MQKLILATIGVALSMSSAHAQDMPGGNYRCMIWDAYLGDIQIKGSVYQGPAYDGNFEGQYPYTVAGGVITWGGPLGGISAAGTIVSTVVTDAGNDQVGFDVTIQNPDGEFQTVSCYPE